MNNEVESSEVGDLVLYKKELPVSFSNEDGAKFNNTVLKTSDTYVFPEKFAIVMKIKIDSDYVFDGLQFFWSQSGMSYDNHASFTGLYMRYSDKISIFNGIFTNESQEITSGTMEKNIWTTLLTQFDGNNLQVYVNGKNVTEGDYKKIGFTNISTPLYIGGSYYTETGAGSANWKYVNGYYKDIAIYNRTFSEDEIMNFNN